MKSWNYLIKIQRKKLQGEAKTELLFFDWK